MARRTPARPAMGLRERVAQRRDRATRTLSAGLHRQLDQADPEEARRAVRLLCEQGLFAEPFVAYLDADLQALRARLQEEGILDAQGRLAT